jgi:hypothetical protein
MLSSLYSAFGGWKAHTDDDGDSSHTTDSTSAAEATQQAGAAAGLQQQELKAAPAAKRSNVSRHQAADDATDDEVRAFCPHGRLQPLFAASKQSGQN